MKIANMATYPAREASTLQIALDSIVNQVDMLNLCLNQFVQIPDYIYEYENVNAYIPDSDYKDVGKFLIDMEDDADVFYVDDDIIYPRDYVSYSMDMYKKYSTLAPIIGYHGTIYSDVFNGEHESRNVFSFRTRLFKSKVVNQLGTGTVHCKGWQCPDLEHMRGSEKYVDVRFAVHCDEKKFPLICLPREAQWLQDQQAGDSIYDGFTKKWPVSVVKEVQAVAGYGRLPIVAVCAVE